MTSPEATPSPAPERRGNALAAGLLAWIVPGAGHLLLGKRVRAVAFFAIVLVALLVGCALDGKLYTVDPEKPLSRLATVATMGMGAPYFAARWGFDYQGDATAPGYEYGTAFILTAGLMNLLLILDAWDIARGVKD